jgi:NAD(P)-dependent dehydrogenase (short-subunit alcohol dehydrogenase family)
MAVAVAFAAAGARVVIAARRSAEGSQTAEEIRAKGGEAIRSPAYAVGKHGVIGTVQVGGPLVTGVAFPVDGGVLAGFW